MKQLLVAFLCTLLPVAARADEASSLALSYEAPPDCPSRDAVLAAIARAGTSAAQNRAALRATLAIVRRDATRLHARLELHGALEAERELDGERCAPLVEAAAWLIAQAARGEPPAEGPATPSAIPAATRDARADAKPSADERPPASEAATQNADPKAKQEAQAQQEATALPQPETPPPTEAPVDDAEDRSEQDAANEQPPSAPRTVDLGLFAWADSGALPKLAVGFGLEFALRVVQLRVAVRPRMLWPQSQAIAQPSSPRAETTLGLAELPLQLCGDFRLGMLRGGPCASAIAGAMWGTSRALSQARSRAGFWLGLEAGVAASVPAEGPFALRAELALATSLLAPRFTIDEARTVHRTDSVLVRASLAALFRP